MEQTSEALTAQPTTTAQEESSSSDILSFVYQVIQDIGAFFQSISTSIQNKISNLNAPYQEATLANGIQSGAQAALRERGILISGHALGTGKYATAYAGKWNGKDKATLFL